jgi:hypothetical protein
MHGTIHKATIRAKVQIMPMKVFIIIDPSADVIKHFHTHKLCFFTVTYNGVLVHFSRVPPSKKADFAMLVSCGCCL